MSKPLDHALDSFFGSILVARDLIAHLDDGAPVLRCQVLVGRLGYMLSSVSWFDALEASETSAPLPRGKRNKQKEKKKTTHR